MTDSCFFSSLEGLTGLEGDLSKFMACDLTKFGQFESQKSHVVATAEVAIRVNRLRRPPSSEGLTSFICRCS